MAADCTGVYRPITLKSGNPRNYKGNTASIAFGNKRSVIRPVEYSERGRTKRAAQVNAARAIQIDAAVTVQEEENGTIPVFVDDTTDDPLFVGEPTGYKGFSSRFSLGGGSYTERPTLAALISNMTTHDQRIIDFVPGEAVPRGPGAQNTAMGGGAVAHSGRKLKGTKVQGRGDEQNTTVAEEWCHLRAAGLGGITDKTNLVAASYACNTFMTILEGYIDKRTDLSAKVTAYLKSKYVAEAIKYEIFKKNKLIYSALIDAEAQHFSKLDYEKMKPVISKAIGKFE